MSGKLKSKVNIDEIQAHYDKSKSYVETAKWARERFDADIIGPHVRYWVSKPEESEENILLFDIETAPMEVYTWGLFNQNIGINQIKRDWYVLMFAAKWFGDTKIFEDNLTNYNSFPNDEVYVLETVWDLLDQADIVVAHNACNFDVKKLNAKFIEYGLQPPSYYKVVDTLKIAKYKFGFTSNKLDYIAQLLGLGQKHFTDFSLWLGCMNNDMDSWKTMIDYCIQDVEVLERVYNEIRGWDNRHPIVHYGNDNICQLCGHDQLEYDGDYNTAASTFEIYACLECGHKQRYRINVANDEEKKTRTVSS